MNPESSRQWQRFLEHAALARAKPTFDGEERDWKLAIADRLQEALGSARYGGDWLSPLNEVYRHPAFRFVSPRGDVDWLSAWGVADPTSPRRALAAFLDGNTEAEARFDSFAEAVETARAKGAVTVVPNVVLRVGSVLNFAAEPESLPMIQPGQFAGLARLLGCQWSQSTAVLDVYAESLAFARRVRSRMEQSGLPVRDMIDVQSLILIAAREHEFWAREDLHPIGVPPPRDHTNLPPGETPDGRRYLTICAGYRNEAPYLAEWIEFHHLVGVEHFFLYNAFSTDNHREVLAPYVEDGIVTIHDWEGISHEQADTYNECLREHRDESRWIAFIDCDEFLFSPTGRSLPEVLSDYEHWPAVAVNTAVFGRSGHKTRPPGLVIENYLMRIDSPKNRGTKSVIDPSRAIRCMNAHHFEYGALLAVDENHYPVHSMSTKSASFERLRINHYVTKSEEEALAKLGRPNEWDDSRLWRSTMIEDSHPQQRDEAITQYLRELRDALAHRARA